MGQGILTAATSEKTTRSSDNWLKWVFRIKDFASGPLYKSIWMCWVWRLMETRGIQKHLRLLLGRQPFCTKDVTVCRYTRHTYLSKNYIILRLIFLFTNSRTPDITCKACNCFIAIIQNQVVNVFSLHQFFQFVLSAEKLIIYQDSYSGLQAECKTAILDF